MLAGEGEAVRGESKEDTLFVTPSSHKRACRHTQFKYIFGTWGPSRFECMRCGLAFQQGAGVAARMMWKHMLEEHAAGRTKEVKGGEA